MPPPQTYLRPTCPKILERKKRFSQQDLKTVNWDSIEAAMTTMTISQKRWTSKFVTGFCATRKKMKQTFQRDSAACPQCRYDLETTVHILQSPQLSSQEWWNLEIRNFRSMLRKLDTHPDIVEDMSSSIHTWHSQLSPPTMLTMAGQQQTILSQNNFTHGFLHCSWWTTQMLYYTTNNSQKSSHKWILTVLQQILKIARRQWDHRNKALHKMNTQLVLDASTNIEINAQYDLRSTDLPKTSSWLLQAPCSSILNLNHRKTLQWIASLKAAQQQQKRAQIISLQAQQQLLQAWLLPDEHPRPQPPHPPRSIGRPTQVQPVAPQGTNSFQTPRANLENSANYKVLSTIL